jgi:acylphosphatase
MIVARRFVVHGRVQGVGFRFFALECARAEGLGGWARNLPDGTIEIFAEGDREAIDRFEHRVRRGPPAARVERADVWDDQPSEAPGSFAIRS